MPVTQTEADVTTRMYRDGVHNGSTPRVLVPLEYSAVLDVYSREHPELKLPAT